MAALVDQDVGLDKNSVRRQNSDERSESYPLQIPVYHCQFMHIYQSPCDVFELSEGIISGGCGQQ